jgi:pimeloyl-ACP methyl ester carboxylesterase
MRTLVETIPGAHSSRLLVLLSGTFSTPEDFVREGFVDAAREHGIEAEIVMAETRLAWFADGSMVDRIRAGVVAPARERGAQRIWFAGISLGALASLCYAARRQGELEGMVLISPYPGTRPILNEIEAAGGLASWQPDIGPEGDLEREAWHWLANRGKDEPEVHCYFGSGDRFADGQRKMAQTLPVAHVHEVPGGHEWKDWRRMWNEVLERNTLR